MQQHVMLVGMYDQGLTIRTGLKLQRSSNHTIRPCLCPYEFSKCLAESVALDANRRHDMSCRDRQTHFLRVLVKEDAVVKH